jgi:hypothetical protein
LGRGAHRPRRRPPERLDGRPPRDCLGERGRQKVDAAADRPVPPARAGTAPGPRSPRRARRRPPRPLPRRRRREARRPGAGPRRCRSEASPWIAPIGARS